jgi:hypothetical protein
MGFVKWSRELNMKLHKIGLLRHNLQVLNLHTVSHEDMTDIFKYINKIWMVVFAINKYCTFNNNAFSTWSCEITLLKY